MAFSWSDAWDLRPSILYIYHHLQTLHDSFFVHKTPYGLGLVIGYRYKCSLDWPPRVLETNSRDHSRILACRECYSLLGKNVLAWGVTLCGQYLVSTRY